MTSRNSQTVGPQTMTEFCEQLNPRVLLNLRDLNTGDASANHATTGSARPMRRVQESWVASAEKRALLWLAARTPDAISPDHLTAARPGRASRCRSVLRSRSGSTAIRCSP